MINSVAHIFHWHVARAAWRACQWHRIQSRWAGTGSWQSALRLLAEMPAGCAESAAVTVQDACWLMSNLRLPVIMFLVALVSLVGEESGV
jgi:hypothetical protein